jgi:hypothetical protein
MNREQLQHAMKSAVDITGADDLVVIGSQSILGSFDEDELPPAAIASIEVDLAFLHDPGDEKSGAVDGGIGEMSAFHDTYGYYAQGVSTSTAVLPNGWWSRLVPVEGHATGHRYGSALEPHDCVVAKLVAGREKDLDFATALIREGKVHVDLLIERARTLDVDHRILNRILAWLAAFSAG